MHSIFFFFLAKQSAIIANESKMSDENGNGNMQRCLIPKMRRKWGVADAKHIRHFSFLSLFHLLELKENKFVVEQNKARRIKIAKKNLRKWIEQPLIVLILSSEYMKSKEGWWTTNVVFSGFKNSIHTSYCLIFLIF